MAAQPVISREEQTERNHSVPEIHNYIDPNWNQGEFQSAVSGEDVAVSTNYKTPTEFQSTVSGEDVAVSTNYKTPTEFQSAVSGEDVAVSTNYKTPTEFQSTVSEEDVEISRSYQHSNVEPKWQNLNSMGRKRVRAVRNNNSKGSAPKPKNENPWLAIVQQIENKNKTDNQKSLPMETAVAITKQSYPGIREDHPDFPRLVAETSEQYFMLQGMMSNQNRQCDKDCTHSDEE